MVQASRKFSPADRYKYDCGMCSPSQGFAQVDTRQDASYYGTWANPEKRIIFTYCEGDCTTTTCDTDEEFIAEMRELEEWNIKNGGFCKVDPGLREGATEPWKRLGLGDMLH
jgi:hypothetical protein